MIKKMIYLEEEMETALERIAQAQRKSVSQVIRDAINQLFQKKEIYDLVEYDRRMAEYLGNPSLAVPFRDVMDTESSGPGTEPGKPGR